MGRIKHFSQPMIIKAFTAYLLGKTHYAAAIGGQ